MNNELNSVVSKIQGLVKMTQNNGCSEGEAMNAAAKIGELLMTYNLTMDKIFLGEQKCIKKDVNVKGINLTPLSSCVLAVASFCDCKVWFMKGNKMIPSHYSFFGLKQDVDMAEYLYTTIEKAESAEIERFKQSDTYKNGIIHRRRLLVSFQKGMASRINDRLQDMTAKRHTAESKATENRELKEVSGVCTDIVILKRDKVKEEFEELEIKLTHRPASCSPINSNAYGEGHNAGSRVNLSRPIENNCQTKLLG